MINHRIGAAILYHDFLHRFRSGRVTGTTYLEDKLLQKLTEMR